MKCDGPLVSTVNGRVASRGDPRKFDGRKSWDEGVAQVMLLLHGRVEIGAHQALLVFVSVLLSFFMQQHALFVPQELSNITPRSADRIKDCLGFAAPPAPVSQRLKPLPRIHTAPSFVHVQQPAPVQVNLH